MFCSLAAGTLICFLVLSAVGIPMYMSLFVCFYLPLVFILFYLLLVLILVFVCFSPDAGTHNCFLTAAGTHTFFTYC